MNRLHAILKKTGVLVFLLVHYTLLFGQGPDSFDFQNERSYPLVGNWVGAWVDPQIGYEKQQPELAAQINLVEGNTYFVVFLPRLHARAVPFLEIQVKEENGGIHFQKNGWQFTFKDGLCQGMADLNGQKVAFNLKKDQFNSPTLGLPPSDGAIVLFDGTNFDQWKHADDRPVTWKLLSPDIMETVSSFWRNGQNGKDGIGGNIETKERFGDLKFHMEFRYSAEPGKSGQQRGNSGLFFNGVGEIQILNSFALPGYWDDCGSIYKRYPAKVNAAGPPWAWQTYDVELIMPRFDQDAGNKISNGMITVWLNGILIHNKLEMNFNLKEVSIGLQDHINAIQFRNIWLEKR